MAISFHCYKADVRQNITVKGDAGVSSSHVAKKQKAKEKAVEEGTKDTIPFAQRLMTYSSN